MYQEKNTDTKPQTDIREGQEIKVRIKAIGAKGDGIGKYKEFTVIVANTKVNDDVDVIVEKITSTNLVFARIK
ncbi:MAG: deoxyribonuclease [Nanoarchaeota archaeon]|nr:deoxyribonuclease [Nanoarchaeota archaeon]